MEIVGLAETRKTVLTGIEMFHKTLEEWLPGDAVGCLLRGIERAQVRKAVAQRNHFLYALRAFLRLEMHKLRTGISWYEAKVSIIREAIRAYLTHPIYSLTTTA